MNQFLQKQVPVRLATRDYEELRERVLRRDGWRCQFCGSITNLEVHHQTFRSHSGDDNEDISSRFARIAILRSIPSNGQQLPVPIGSSSAT